MGVHDREEGVILSIHEVERRGIVLPFCEQTVFHGCTYGAGPAGYDVRVEFDSSGSIYGKPLLPGEFLLVSTVEEFNMPDDVIGIVHDKSSLARQGLAVQNTVVEPGWRGFLTLELTNHGPENVHLVRGQGIAQVLFHRLSEPATRPYSGKYQNQGRGPQEAI